jgi:hypothetical protein
MSTNSIQVIAIYNSNTSLTFFRLITNWWAFHSNAISDEQVLIQFDGYTATGGKLDAMRNFGFYFLNNDGKTCNESLVEVRKKIALRIGYREEPMFIFDRLF